jgi:cysteine sulfinate desulfinase/cysteine desulfurase-like protein
MRFTETGNGFIMHIDLVTRHFGQVSIGDTVTFAGHKYKAIRAIGDLVEFITV